MKRLRIIWAFLPVLAVVVLSGMVGRAYAAPVTINFDVAQANYTPSSSERQVVDDQFAPIGVKFRDGDFPSLGVVVGNNTSGAGSDPVHLYSNNGSGGFDTNPNINIYFVDPSNSSLPGYTTSFSVFVTDGSDTVMTAYDRFGGLLGIVTSTKPFNERLTLSGIGQISRINLSTPTDPTGYDDLIFDEVSGIGGGPQPVPEPSTLLLLGTGLAGVGAAGFRKLKSRREIKL